MGIVDCLRRWRFNPSLIRFAKFIHFHGLVRKMYYKSILSLSNKIRIAILGYDAEFYARNISELSLVESFLVDERDGEIRVIQKLLEELKAGEVAYDIGASIGTHAVFMALKVGKYGKVIAFEPEKNSFKDLIANIDLNKINNIIPFKVALGDSRKEGIIKGGLGSFTLSEENSFVSVEKIKIVDARSFIQENKLPVPSVIKIDVEGYEYNVIKGLEDVLRDKNCRMVACEIHPTLLPKGISVDDIIGLLISCGFEKPQIYPRGFTLHTFFMKADT